MTNFSGYFIITCLLAQWQEMALIESSSDGDVEGVIHALESGVCVDVTKPVSSLQSSKCKLCMASKGICVCQFSDMF